MPIFATRTASWLRPSERTTGNSGIIFLILLPKHGSGHAFLFYADARMYGADGDSNNLPLKQRRLSEKVILVKKNRILFQYMLLKCYFCMRKIFFEGYTTRRQIKQQTTDSQSIITDELITATHFQSPIPFS